MHAMVSFYTRSMFGVVVECALLWVVSEKLLCLPRLCFRAPIDTHLNLGFVREAQRAQREVYN